MVKAVAPLYGTHRYVEVLRHHAQENAVVLLSRLLDGLWKHGEELQCVVIAASMVQPVGVHLCRNEAIKRALSQCLRVV